MFKKFVVFTHTMNLSDGESTDVVMKDTQKEAIDTFYAKCASFGTNPQTKTCEVIVINPEGEIIRIEKIDNMQYIVEE